MPSRRCIYGPDPPDRGGAVAARISQAPDDALSHDLTGWDAGGRDEGWPARSTDRAVGAQPPPESLDSVRGGVAEDVDARLREPFQIWIAPADLPYVQSIRDAFGLTAVDDLGKPLPDRLMSPESSTRTVHDLSPWAALSIKFAGLLTALGGAVTGG